MAKAGNPAMESVTTVYICTVSGRRYRLGHRDEKGLRWRIYLDYKTPPELIRIHEADRLQNQSVIARSRALQRVNQGVA